MLDKALKIILEIDHPDAADAVREIVVTKADVKYFQIVLKRMDRDDSVIQAAIDEAMWMRNYDLAGKLKKLLEPVKVPYEELTEGM